MFVKSKSKLKITLILAAGGTDMFNLYFFALPRKPIVIEQTP